MLLYLKVEHLKGADIEGYSDETHSGFFDVNHMLIKGLNVVVVDSYTAGFVKERKTVSVT